MQDNSPIHPDQRFLLPFLFLLIFTISSSTPMASGQQNNSLPANDAQTKTTVENFVTASTSPTETQILRLYAELFQKAYITAPEVRIARARKEQKSVQRYTAWAKRLAPAVDARLSQIH